VLLSVRGEVKLTDFGIAKARDRAVRTRTGVVQGKFEYLAPEQANAEPVDRRTDVLLGDKVVGRVSSTCVSPRFGPIALALVRREASPGETVRVGTTEAEVVELPFASG
jgi:serine/threonine protein kinase